MKYKYCVVIRNMFNGERMEKYCNSYHSILAFIGMHLEYAEITDFEITIIECEREYE